VKRLLPSLTTAMPDGSSNTIMFAERYKNCSFSWQTDGTVCAWAWFPYGNSIFMPYGFPGFGIPNDPNAAFWAALWGVENLGPRYSFGNLPFQAAPSPSDCEPRVTQTAHTGGMVVGLGDGSVRIVSEGISVTTWVHACIPNDGNPLGSDW
jgi:Protein of unknown function (DUF1559)